MIRMKRLLLIVSAAFFLASIGNTEAADATKVFQIHFLGMDELSGNTNAAKLTKIWNLPETVELREKTFQKIATAPEQLFPQTIKQKHSFIQPLLGDLLRRESIIQLLETTNGSLQLNLAVQLDKKRSAMWSSNLQAVASTTSGDLDQWSSKLSGNTTIKFGHDGKWTYVVIGLTGIEKPFITSLGKSESVLQTDHWLEADIDWTRMERCLGISTPFQVSQSKIVLTGKADNLFTTVTASFPEKISWKRTPWHIPTVILDPIDSFTAAQPLSAFCKPSAFFKQIGFNPLDREFFFWSQSDLPFQTFGAVVAEDSTNQMQTLSAKLPAIINPVLADRRSGQLYWSSSNNLLNWTNLPLLAPYLHPYHDSAGQFLVGGLFPRAPRKTPAPNEIFKHIIDNEKLVYYNWEITEHRIGHWDMLTRLAPVLSPELISPDPSKPLRLSRNSRLPAHIWIRQVASYLGNTVTEATVSGPKELTIKRKSHIGFNGMELMYFVGLLDHPDFPLFNHKFPQATSNSK